VRAARRLGRVEGAGTSGVQREFHGMDLLRFSVEWPNYFLKFRMLFANERHLRLTIHLLNSILVEQLRFVNGNRSQPLHGAGRKHGLVNQARGLVSEPWLPTRQVRLGALVSRCRGVASEPWLQTGQARLGALGSRCCGLAGETWLQTGTAECAMHLDFECKPDANAFRLIGPPFLARRLPAVLGS
jgi:hypothetical protein